MQWCDNGTLGAFAAHGLSHTLAPYLLDVFKVGIQYQAWHTLALLACGILSRFLPSKALSYAALFFGLGIICFSGSLYALALTGIKWFDLYHTDGRNMFYYWLGDARNSSLAFSLRVPT